MKQIRKNIIYTIGHSTNSIDKFLEILTSFNIKILVDIRRFPGSKKYPWFNREPLEAALKEKDIQYIHLEALGGRRKVLPDSKNDKWHNSSFRGYADYMETPAFETAVTQLENIAIKQPTVYMCAEAVWWRCHRAMVSDYLKAKGWTVLHIMASNKTEEHPYTPVARVINDQVFYYDENLFNH